MNRTHIRKIASLLSRIHRFLLFFSPPFEEKRLGGRLREENALLLPSLKGGREEREEKGRDEPPSLLSFFSTKLIAHFADMRLPSPQIA